MASQHSFKLPYKLPTGKTVDIKLVINRRSAQKEYSISSSSTQQGNGDKSSSCDEICGSSIETAAAQEDSKPNSETTAVKSKDGFTIIRWEGLKKTKFNDNTCASKDKVILNTTDEKLANENVISKQEINNSNITDPKQNHPVNYQFIPMDRSNGSQETVESEVLNLASRKQPVVVKRIKVEPDLMVFKIPEELGKNMQAGWSENIGNIKISQDSVAGTLLDVNTEECSIECSEQGMFLRGVTEPYTSSGAQQETKQSEDEMLASRVDNEDFVMSKQTEEEIQSVIQTNVEEMLISEQTSKGEGFTYSFPFACGLCNYTAKLQQHLKIHMKTHMSDRPFVCEICDKGFKRVQHLSEHKWTHSRERPYSCEHCGRGFTQKSNLRQHQRIHQGLHQGLMERYQHKCYTCGKSFSMASYLRRHSKMHTNLERKVRINKKIKKKKLTYNPTVDDHQRKFECGVCGRKFTKKDHVMQHMLTHTGESIYTCEVCGKGYSRKKALEKHINIHTGDDIEVDEDDTGSSSSSDSSGEDDMEDC